MRMPLAIQTNVSGASTHRTDINHESVHRYGWRVAQEARRQLQNYNWSAALTSCNEILDLDPDHLGALEVKAQALWFGGQYDRVVSVTTHLLRLNPSEPGYRYTRGMANLSRGRFLDSRRDFEYAINQSDNEGFRSQVREAMNSLCAWQDSNQGRTSPAVAVVH